MGSFTTEQQNILLLVAISCGCLSIVTSTYMITNYFIRKYQKEQIDFESKLVIVLLCLDWFSAVPKLFGRSFVDQPILCNLQALFMFFGSLSVGQWQLCMTFHMYRWIVCRESDAKLRSRFWMYLFFTLSVPLGFGIYHLTTHSYGDASFYCWIHNKMYQFYHFFLLHYLCVAGAIILIFMIRVHVKRCAQRNENAEADQSSAIIRRRLLLYTMVFIVDRIPSFLYRILETFGIQNFLLAILMQAFLNLHGFANCVIYGGVLIKNNKKKKLPLSSPSSPLPPLHDTNRQRVTKPTVVPAISTLAAVEKNLLDQYDDIDLENGSFLTDTALIQNGGNDTTGTIQKTFIDHLTETTSRTVRRKNVSIFVSTFNMGEAKVTLDSLTCWVPLGHDVYVIGVQECMDLTDFRTKLRKHLNGKNSRHDGGNGGVEKEKFTFFCREIGNRNTALGYHGHIALTIFVRRHEVEKGHFYLPMTTHHHQRVSCGKSLVIGRASNKGAVGIAFRYHDTSFAFVTCHLASDSKGKSKVARRNMDAADILQELHLSEDDHGFSFSTLHHHSFILGDLNYRLTNQKANSSTILDLVAKAKAKATFIRPISQNHQQTHHVTNTKHDQAHDAYVLLQSPSHGMSSPTSQSRSSCTSILPIKSPSNECPWKKLLEHDELTHLMRKNQVFQGFKEVDIQFAPTYRRVRQKKFSDAESLEAFFCTSVDGAGERVPSYTDRILFTSLSGYEDKLECTSYTCCEEMIVSDHRPVSAVFIVQLDRRQIHTPAIRFATDFQSKMKHFYGVVELNLSIKYTNVQWIDTSNENVEGQWMFTLQSLMKEKVTDRLWHFYASDRVEVCFVFPIPSEDIFSEQRKLHEVAGKMVHGLISSVDSSIKQKTNFHCISWKDFITKGIHHHAIVQRGPTRNLHVAMLLRTSSKCLGQSTFCIHDLMQEDTEIKCTLSTGGRLTGRLTLQAKLQHVT